MPLLSCAPPLGHRILVVEDHDDTRACAIAWLTARGDRPRGVANVEEAFRAMQEEDFCCYVVDQELPFTKDSIPLVIGGQRVVEAVRAADNRRRSVTAFV